MSGRDEMGDPLDQMDQLGFGFGGQLVAGVDRPGGGGDHEGGVVRPVGWEWANYLSVLASWAPGSDIGDASALRALSD